MSWLKLDDGFAGHPKMIGLSHRAFRLHVSALCYAAQNLTDGVIAKAALPIVGAYSGKNKALTDELEHAKLWVAEETGWRIHGYLDLNPSKADVEKRRAEAKAAADKRWSSKANGNANGNASGIAGGNALPSHPIPTLPQTLHSVPFPALDVGTDNTPLGKLRRACRVDEGSEDEKKLERAMSGVAEVHVVDIAYSAPANVRDRLAWTLAELKKRRTAA